jgi:hypothetical protein
MHHSYVSCFQPEEDNELKQPTTPAGVRQNRVNAICADADAASVALVKMLLLPLTQQLQLQAAQIAELSLWHSIDRTQDSKALQVQGMQHLSDMERQTHATNDCHHQWVARSRICSRVIA